MIGAKYRRREPICFSNNKDDDGHADGRLLKEGLATKSS